MLPAPRRPSYRVRGSRRARGSVRPVPALGHPRREITHRRGHRAAARAYSLGLRLTIRPPAAKGFRALRGSTASGVSAHCFRASRTGGNAQPSMWARTRTPAILRLSATEALTIEAPRDANAFRRSSSSTVHGRTNRRISMAKADGADRKDEDDRADPNENGGFLLGNGWRRFHDRITAP
jgi:hypothetical protein